LDVPLVNSLYGQGTFDETGFAQAKEKCHWAKFKAIS